LTCYSGYGLDAKDPGDPAALKRHALCLSLADGRILWNKEVPVAGRETQYSGPYITMHGYASSTPVTDGERVYFFFNTSGVVAYSLDGEKLWETSVDGRPHAWGAGASPVLFENLLIVNAG